MKLNKRMLSLLLCILTVLTLLPSAVFASEDAAVFCAGSATDSVVVSASCSADLSVSVAAESYQWEIYVPSADVWAGILNCTENTLSVTDAMVNNARNGAGYAKIRCRYLQQGEMYYSSVVSVSIDNSLVAALDVATSVYTLAAPMMMRSAAPAPEDGVRYTISIRYEFEDGSIASNPYTAVIPENESFVYTVETPAIAGYTAYCNDQVCSEIALNFAAVTTDVTYTVIYKPADVTYTVEHYYQNVDGSYAAPETESKTTKTGSLVPDNLAKVVTGFYALPYVRPAAEGDGSTVVEIRYNRNYYLVNFDIADGYGTDSVYAPYGASIPTPSDPTRTGYAFQGWSPAVPKVMPAYNTTCVAQWKTSNAKYTIVYWHENADDDGYSQYATKIVNSSSGSVVSGKNGDSFTGSSSNEHTKYFTYERADQNVTVKGDNSTVVNVYYSRNEYTVYFNLKHASQVKGSDWGKQDSYDKVNIEMTIMVDGELKTFKESNGDIYSFTAKYDSDISNKWPTADNFDSKYYFRRWQYDSGNYWASPQAKMTATFCKAAGYYCYADCGTSDSMIAYYMIESFDQTSPEGGSYETKDRRVYNSNLKKYYDMSVADTKLVMSSAAEDQWTKQKDIVGTEIVGSMTRIKNTTPQQVYMYYDRLRYTLKLYTGETKELAEISNVMYGKPMNLIDEMVDYVNGEAPIAPDNLEQGAYEFAGWYSTAEFHEGTEVDLATYTMPNGNTELYAKWVPVTRTVKTYLTKEAMDGGAAPLGTYTATHNTKVETTVPNPVNGNDFFVGWFYRSGNTDVAFDFGSMPVTANMSVFAKWSPNPIKTYTVHYQLADGTPVADSTVGEDLVDEVKQFLPKGGEELYEAYRTDYYPHTRECEIVISADPAANSFTFVYSKQETVIPYTVRYLIKDTETQLRPDKNVPDNKQAIVEEQFEPVGGYIPNCYQQVYALIPGEENVVIFWYEKDEENVPYRISHYIESVEGGAFTKEYTYVEASAVVGTELTAAPKQIDGFTFDPSIAGTVLSGTVSTDGAHLKLYYTRNQYPYEIRYMCQGTLLRDPVVDMGKYNDQQVFTAAQIPGYTVDGDSQQTLTVQIEETAYAQKNVLTFHYTENVAVINYVAVGPDGCGTVTLEREEVAAATGTAQGSTAEPSSKSFCLVGWYQDPECTVPVPAAQCSGNTFTPAKTGADNLYESKTYYAKFAYNVADLTIRNNNVADTDAPFVYRVKGTDNDVDLKVVVYGNGSVTVKDLVSGTYTVTEVTGYWRYGTSSARNITLSGQAAVITFTSSKENYLWLDDYAHKTNTHSS